MRHASFRDVGSRHVVSAVVVVAIALTMGESQSFAAPDGGADDITALETQLKTETTALSTSDCNSACRALQSIRRAADKICAIEPGPRCDAARSKANDATKRVQDACPDCVVALNPSPTPPPDRAGASGGNGVPSPPPAPAMESTQSAPDRGRGGCASCASTDAKMNGSETDLGIVLAAAFGVLRICRKSRRIARSKKKDR